MALRPSSVPLRVPLPPPPESSLPAVPDPESDRARAASPTISCLLVTVVTDPSFECALGTGVLEDRQEELECLAAAVPRFASTLLAPEGDPMHQTSRPRALTVRRGDYGVKRPPGSPPAFKARYVARGFSHLWGGGEGLEVVDPLSLTKA
ncbi:unnamed protein product [Closterium sp. NIES-54]